MSVLERMRNVPIKEISNKEISGCPHYRYVRTQSSVSAREVFVLDKYLYYRDIRKMSTATPNLNQVN